MDFEDEKLQKQTFLTKVAEKIFFEILEDYNGVCLKISRRMQQNLDNGFCQIS